MQNKLSVTCQVGVALELVIEYGAVGGDENGVAEGEGVVAHAREEEQRAVPQRHRHRELRSAVHQSSSDSFSFGKSNQVREG